MAVAAPAVVVAVGVALATCRHVTTAAWRAHLGAVAWLRRAPMAAGEPVRAALR